ncbi:hypothetical protein SELMODRAFT_100569 [Selaginella moellendorffii]|uniref:Uncharacterized protein n=2 Tax=Selaginella moellendorffii TaxID=88036 RepID=D8RS69_SELML|nr:hypothetical protein SELMODRAFT_100569 [Selaginella moellendorffii]
MAGLVFLSILALVVAIPHTTLALELVASNASPASPGGQRFDAELGINGALSMMVDAIHYIQMAFAYSSPATPRKTVDTITFTLEDMPGVAYTYGSQFHLSASYVAGYTGEFQREMRSIVYHEMTHVWQWDGKDGNRAPSGLIEGIASFITLSYVNDLRPGFVTELNSKLATGWSESFFSDLTGKSVEQL